MHGWSRPYPCARRCRTRASTCCKSFWMTTRASQSRSAPCHCVRRQECECGCNRSTVSWRFPPDLFDLIFTHSRVCRLLRRPRFRWGMTCQRWTWSTSRCARRQVLPRYGTCAASPKPLERTPRRPQPGSEVGFSLSVLWRRLEGGPCGAMPLYGSESSSSLPLSGGGRNQLRDVTSAPLLRLGGGKYV